METVNSIAKQLLLGGVCAFLLSSLPASAKEVNIENFGAKSGAPDNQAAFDAAVKAANTSQPAIVDVPAGSFNHSGVIYLKGASLKGLAGIQSSVVATNSQQGTINLTGANTFIKGLVVEYETPSPSSSPLASGVWVHAANNALVTQITVNKTSGDGIYIDGQSLGMVDSNVISNQSMAATNAGIHAVNEGKLVPIPHQPGSYYVETCSITRNNLQVSGIGILAHSSMEVEFIQNTIDGKGTQKGPGIGSVQNAVVFALANTMRNLPAGAYVEQNPTTIGWISPVTVGGGNTISNCGRATSGAVVSLNPTNLILVADTISNCQGDGYLVTSPNKNQNTYSLAMLVDNNITTVGNNGYDLSNIYAAVVLGNIQNTGAAALAYTPLDSTPLIAYLNTSNCGVKDVHNNPPPGGHNAVIDIHASPATVTVENNTYTGPAVNGLDYFVYDPHAGTQSTGNTTNTALPSFFGP
jgi:hypothetical protein